MRHINVRDMFPDDAALVTQSQQQLQHMLDSFAKGCNDFNHIVNLTKTNVMRQGAAGTASLTINNYQLKAESNFTNLGSTASNEMNLAKSTAGSSGPCLHQIHVMCTKCAAFDVF